MQISQVDQSHVCYFSAFSPKDFACQEQNCGESPIPSIRMPCLDLIIKIISPSSLTLRYSSMTLLPPSPDFSSRLLQSVDILLARCSLDELTKFSERL